MSTLALIALGSNLGDRKAALDAALAALAATPGVILRAASRYHETEAVGGPAGQGAFLNAAAAVETTLGPWALLSRLRQIETDAGRVRSVRWGERTLDLDLLMFGEAIIDSVELSVPHPRMAVRRFVLVPLVEIVPDAVEPITLRTMTELLENLDRRPGYVAIASSGSPSGPAIARRVAEALGAEPLLRSGPPDDYGALRRDARRLAEQIAVGRREPDRWIISGFNIADEAVAWWHGQLREISSRRGRPDRVEMESGTRRMESIVAEAPPPTFGVSFPERVRRDCSIGAEAPSLLFAPDSDPETVASEILAACAASRCEPRPACLA
jgi:2-amino-4-hydroxy-6-hydroxymethyldihydropteridine diphosphokinase